MEMQYDFIQSNLCQMFITHLKIYDKIASKTLTETVVAAYDILLSPIPCLNNICDHFFLRLPIT